jgi:hypothetical protein
MENHFRRLIPSLRSDILTVRIIAKVLIQIAGMASEIVLKIAGMASEIVLKRPLKCEKTGVWMFIFNVGIYVGTMAKDLHIFFDFNIHESLGDQYHTSSHFPKPP